MGVPSLFTIKAKDEYGNDNTDAGDSFIVELKSASGKPSANGRVAAAVARTTATGLGSSEYSASLVPKCVFSEDVVVQAYLVEGRRHAVSFSNDPSFFFGKYYQVFL